MSSSPFSEWAFLKAGMVAMAVSRLIALAAALVFTVC